MEQVMGKNLRPLAYLAGFALTLFVVGCDPFIDPWGGGNGGGGNGGGGNGGGDPVDTGDCGGGGGGGRDTLDWGGDWGDDGDTLDWGGGGDPDDSLGGDDGGLDSLIRRRP